MHSSDHATGGVAGTAGVALDAPLSPLLGALRVVPLGTGVIVD